MICPCCSGRQYAECCKPYHDGKKLPATALDLMRSRYCAYALAKADYIIETTHPSSPYFEKDKKKWKKAILEFSHASKFENLEILDTGEDWVHFIAHLGNHTLNEKSQFVKLNDRWLYLKGEITYPKQ